MLSSVSTAVLSTESVAARLSTPAGFLSEHAEVEKIVTIATIANTINKAHFLMSV